MMEATIKELWQEYTRKYLAKFGELNYPNIFANIALHYIQEQ